MEVKHYKKSKVLEGAGKELTRMLEEVGTIPTLFMSSGGSSLAYLDWVQTENLGSNITITTLDERHSLKPQDSNFSKLEETTFFKALAEKGCPVIDPRSHKNEDLTSAVSRFEQTLRNWRENNQGGKIIITQGVSADGHTAGMLKHKEDREEFIALFENEEKWVVGREVGANENLYTKRITTTLPFLRNQVDSALVFMSGEVKKEALRRILSDSGDIFETPARVIKEMKNVVLITDIQLD